MDALDGFVGLPWDLQSKPERPDTEADKPWGGAEPHHGDNVAKARQAQAERRKAEEAPPGVAAAGGTAADPPVPSLLGICRDKPRRLPY